MSEEFGFETGDTVLVRLREHGDTGHLRAKFVADVMEFRAMHEMLPDTVVLDPPWDEVVGLKLAPHDAEFEVVESSAEVNF